MLCWEWSSYEVGREQGSDPKGMMSCSTLGGISLLPSFLTGFISGLRWMIWATEGIYEGWRVELRFGEQIWGLEGWFWTWRADLRSGGQIWGLTGRFEAGSWFKAKRANLWSGGLSYGSGGVILGLDGQWGGVRWKDRRWEIPHVLQDINPLGPLPKKETVNTHNLFGFINDISITPTCTGAGIDIYHFNCSVTRHIDYY